MWKEILRFEVRYWLRSWMLWIFMLVIALMVFGAVSSDNIVIGGRLDNTYRNAPFVIENYYSIMCILTLLMTTAFVNSAAARDFSANTDQILFSTPISKMDFFLGRYLGSSLIAVIPMLGISVGILVAKYMPWVDAERWRPIHAGAHLWGVLTFAVPNTLLVGAIIFAIAALTRSTAMSFLAALVLMTGYGVGAALSTDIRNETWAALLDPFGIRTFALMTKYWTVSEKNAQAIGYSGLLLGNRLIWIAAAAIIFAGAYRYFSFAPRSKKSKPAALAPEAGALSSSVAEPSYSAGALLAQFRSLLRNEFLGLVKSTSFIVIAAAALLNVIPSLILNSSEGFGNTSLPVTYRMVELIEGSLYLFTIIMVVYYAGVLVWREHDSRADEIMDALPYPEWLAYAAKFAALMLALLLIQLTVMASGVLVQAFSGYYRFQLDLYATELLFMDFTWFVFLAVLAFFFHVISPNKYVGYFAYIAFLIAGHFGWAAARVSSHMVEFGARPDVTYSDFFGHAPFMPAWLWFTLYWSAFSGMLAVGSILLWRRGRETAWRRRAGIARLRLRGIPAVLGILFVTAFAASGAVVYYNTKVLNHFMSPKDADDVAADYEKTYKKYRGLTQPRVTDIKYFIDLFPESRNATMRGHETIINKSAKPIGELHVTVDSETKTDLEMAGLSLQNNDERLHYRIYKIDPPLQPGESRPLKFTVQSRTRGFENDVSNVHLVQNGTFFNNGIAPQIGYQEGVELTNKNERKKRGLKEKDRMPALERGCTVHCMDSYMSNSSDLVTVESVVSTLPDQIAIAPGSLIREWNQNGRRYFHYKLDHPSMNFYSFLSARYQVVREEFKGITAEIYYLKEHPWNVERMRQSIRKSFEYFTTNFSPYRQKQARIIEFPRVARFAQAFPGTMPYSEAIGFVADLKHPDDIDHVFYIVAHEMAHQWWAYQIIGANMQGATLLSETLAQYSALMVMEKEYGRDMMRKFLKYEADNYLRARGGEMLKEQPLLKVESSQGYIHYRKGSLVMYYMREMIGEEAVNRALRKILARYAYAEPPYPTSYTLIDALRAETPPELQYLIKDLFEDITLFSNRTLKAVSKKRADGKYDVTVEVESRKFKADEKGNETEVPVNDWIEVGAIAKPDKGKKLGRVLHRERVHITQAKGTFTFIVDQAPDKAGIDPLSLLIDRIPDDNMKSVDLT